MARRRCVFYVLLAIIIAESRLHGAIASTPETRAAARTRDRLYISVEFAPSTARLTARDRAVLNDVWVMLSADGNVSLLMCGNVDGERSHALVWRRLNAVSSYLCRMTTDRLLKISPGFDASVIDAQVDQRRIASRVYAAGCEPCAGDTKDSLRLWLVADGQDPDPLFVDCSAAVVTRAAAQLAVAPEPAQPSVHPSSTGFAPAR